MLPTKKLGAQNKDDYFTSTQKTNNPPVGW